MFFANKRRVDGENYEEKQFFSERVEDLAIFNSTFKNCYFYNCSFEHSFYSKVNFINCFFRDCYFQGSFFEKVVFHETTVSDCNFTESSFRNCHLQGLWNLSDFSYTFFCDKSSFLGEVTFCNFYDARIASNSTFSPNYDDTTPSLCLVCPQEGSFIGYKVSCEGYLIKLLIPEDAKRNSSTTRKCRCSKAIVLEISDGAQEAHSIYDRNFVYRPYDTIFVSNFDDNRWNRCSTGIHFFLTKEEAKKYWGREVKT